MRYKTRLRVPGLALKKRSKWGSTRARVDDILFDSILESKYYCHLKILKRIGEVEYWLRQVPIFLPGGKKYKCDFLVFYKDGSYNYIDVKGAETPEFKIKKSVVEAMYPIKIKIVKKGDF